MFKLISDTSCDWIKEYAEEHNVTLVPLYTTFDGQTIIKCNLKSAMMNSIEK